MERPHDESDPCSASSARFLPQVACGEQINLTGYRTACFHISKAGGRGYAGSWVPGVLVDHLSGACSDWWLGIRDAICGRELVKQEYVAAAGWDGAKKGGRRGAITIRSDRSVVWG